MGIGAILTIIFLLIAIILLINILFTRKKIKELRSKTDFALDGESVMKISFESENEMGHIASNFNSLIGMYQGLEGESRELQKDRKEKMQLDSKVKGFEESLSQVTLLTEIGKKITSSLNVEDIMRTVYDYVKSTMDVEELELLYLTDSQENYNLIGADGKMVDFTDKVEKKRAHVMSWTLENNREVFLNDAPKDYAQYVFEPISTLSGKSPNAAICIPLFLHEKKIGAVAVTSSHKDVYNVYHLEFLRTLASYLAVALDNSNVYQLLETGKEQIELEKAKSDDLLLNILPAEVAEELKEKGHAKAKSFDTVTVMFTDFVNFTGISEHLSPEELVAEIDTCFKAFDGIIDQFKLEKIKTIGDAYLAVCGMPNEDPEHGTNVVRAAFAIREFMLSRAEVKTARMRDIRIGINSGPVVAGIVGVKKFAYDIWGDTVNTAARMEQQSESGKINISGSTYELVKDMAECTYRGKIEAKNKGEIDMYFVDSIKG